MKFWFSNSTFVFLFFSIILSLPALGHIHEEERKAYFVPNQGQWDESILYHAGLRNADLYVKRNSLVFVLHDERKVDELLSFKHGSWPKVLTLSDFIIDHYAFEIRFEGSSPEAGWRGVHTSGHYLNFFLGNGRSAGGIRAQQQLICDSLYPGVSLELSIEDGNLKYLYKLLPGTDPSRIRLEIDPGARMKKDAAGRLNIPLPLGPMIDARPVAWTIGPGGKETVNCVYKVRGNSYSFKLRDKVAAKDTLIIDPVLSFASYSGSSADNWGYTATYDQEGFLYTAGIAFDPGFPVTLGAYQDTFNNGACDIAISKYDTSGSFLIYSTYLGGSGTEVPSSLIVNNSNELVVLGTTGSSDFPMEGNSYDPSFNGGTNYVLTNVLGFPSGSDIVLSRFSPDGTSLLSSTYFGGFGNDGLNMYPPLRRNYADDIRGEVLVDEQDNIYVISSTSSTNLPTNPGAYQPNYAGGAQDAFVAKFSRDMAVRIWATFIGGDSIDAGYSIAFGRNGDFYVSGGTKSLDLDANGGYQFQYGGGGADGFIYKLSADGDNLLAGTYIGGSRYDQAYFVETDRDGMVYALGQTGDTLNTFIQNVSWSTAGGGQFISKYNPDLDNRIWSTSWGTGGSGPDVSPSAFMVDLCYNIYLSAWGGPLLNNFGGTSGLPVTPDALYPTTDNNDYYFLVLDKDITQPVYATFYGGSSADHVDGGTSRFDRRGTIYQAVCAGCGGEDDFPTTQGAWSNLNGSSNCNNAVIKMDFNLPLVIADFAPLVSGCVPYTLNFQNASTGPAGSPQTFEWEFGDGGTSSVMDPAHTYTSSGVYPVRLVVSDTGACNYSDTLTRFVVILSGATDTLPDVDLCEGDMGHLGLPPSPDPAISYQWSPNTGLSDATVPNPLVSVSSSQDYSLIVSNGLCADTFSQRVILHEVDVELGPDTSVCIDTLTLKALVNKSGMAFHWSSQPDFSNILNTDLSADSVEVVINGPETFYVRVNDGYCEDVDSINVDFLVITSPLSPKYPSCAGYCDGELSSSASGGTAPYTFEWSNGATTSTASGLCAGTYSLTITDANACVSISQATLEEPDSLVAAMDATSIPCMEACIGTIEADVYGGTAPYTYTWDDGQGNATAAGLCAGPHTLTVTDANGCELIKSAEVILDWVFEDIVVSPLIDTIYKGQQSTFEATGIQGVAYQWFPQDGLTAPFQAVTGASPDKTTLYTLLAEDNNGCIYTDSVKVVVLDVICREPYIYVPNAFTPNGDNLNDILYVRSAVAAEVRLVIYDRWGEKVFETTEQSRGWDGTHRGQACDPGVFVYYLGVTCFDEQVFEKKGNITLIR